MEQLGEEGQVEESQKLLVFVDVLKKQKGDLEKPKKVSVSISSFLLINRTTHNKGFMQFLPLKFGAKLKVPA